MDMKKTITRRSFFKGIWKLIFTTLIASTVGYIYSRFIEPKQIKMNYYSIQHNLIPKSFSNMKIVQFSDTHVGHSFTEEDLVEVVNKINKEKPDIVFFTGDLMDDPLHYERAEDLIAILKKINAPYGKFSIYGNHDHGGYGTEIYEEIMNKADFKLLKNENVYIEAINSEKIYIAGVDDLMLGRPSFTEALDNIPSENFTILLVHEPDIADEISRQFRVQLQLSGHTHGGQVQIPFVGPIITPPLGSKYVEGFFYINDLTLYVNRGLGTTRQPYRFFAPPEITVFSLQHVDRDSE
ncbi:metallophosphoesterase [Sutcliffiella cohnii]|uniref:Metallophosphoesterase n=2 Tax=Bacillaceae TaxID=186817 RepID=A0A223KQE1_9BACI|nr:metallophosphoesterase [Sutcliffiella cohnii]